jgi:8-oxo-dGTP diphosphatase
MENERDKIKVGIGVMIFKPTRNAFGIADAGRGGKILLGKRKGSFGDGEYAFPGGHLEYMESFEDCAKRETAEECGIKIKNVKFQILANLIEWAPKQYIQVGLVADWESGEPEVLEPNKCESWAWYDIDNLPSPIFYASAIGIDAHKTNKNYLDILKK